MAANDKEILPTDFAISLLEEVGFVDRKVSGANLVEINKKYTRIADFQKMAITSPMDVAMIAFHGIELDDDVREVLKVVFDSTKPYIMGLTVEACINAVTYKTLGKNEFAEALKTLTEQTKEKVTQNPTGRMRGIVVRVSKSEE